MDSAGVFDNTMYLHTVAGCDSVVGMKITVNPSYVVNVVHDTIFDDDGYGRPETTSMLLQSVDGCDSLVVITFQVGLDAVDDMQLLTLYPNPTDREVTIAVADLAEDAVVAVFDMTGRKVMDAAISAATGKKTLDVSRLSAGSYIVRVEVKAHACHRKLLIR